VANGFNADYDGDQMAVHVPLTKEAVDEAANIMLSTKNLLKPATGDPVVSPNQDIVWGAYYITSELETKKTDNELKCFSDSNEARLAYENNYIVLAPATGANPVGTLVVSYFLRPNQLVADERAAISNAFSKLKASLELSTLA
jgi:DNA-directed RNA polymerase subunit beta'